MNKDKKAERRSYICEVRAENGTEATESIIEGRPIVYGSRTDLGWFDEIIDAGALDNADLTDVRFLVNHDLSKIPLARSRNNNMNSTMQLRPNEDGLDITARIDIENNADAKALDSAVFPGMQGGPLENIIAAKAVVFREWMMPEKKGYAQQVVKNCAVLCKTVQDRGYRIVSGGTDNHLFLVDVKTTKGITGKEAAAALDAAGIVVNKNTIPYDTESPFKTSGIRVGTASVTTRGMKEAEMVKIGTWIADVLDNIADTSVQERVKREAAELVAGFPVP